jgi:hypothetical protein
MAITIENPTAEEIYEALKQVPESELERLRVMLSAGDAEQTEEVAWHQASRTSATRFFEDEDKQ